jgi:hypothetical protein
MSTMGALKGLLEHLRVSENLAQVLPNQFIKLTCRNHSRRAFVVATGMNGIALAATDIVSIRRAIAVLTSNASQVAHAAGHQRAQQVIVSSVVPARKLTVVCKFLLYLFKHVLRHNGRDGGRQEPLLARQSYTTWVMTNRLCW